LCFASAVDIALVAVVAVVGDLVTPLGDGVVVAAAIEVVIVSGLRAQIMLLLLSH